MFNNNTEILYNGKTDANNWKFADELTEPHIDVNVHWSIGIHNKFNCNDEQNETKTIQTKKNMETVHKELCNDF